MKLEDFFEGTERKGCQTLVSRELYDIIQMYIQYMYVTGLEIRINLYRAKRTTWFKLQLSLRQLYSNWPNKIQKLPHVVFNQM